MVTIEATYRDYASATEEDVAREFEEESTTLKTKPRRRQTDSFPVNLHYMLSEMEKDGQDHVISWQPHGRCFVVRNKILLEKESLPFWFRQSKFASFQRQLTYYGFRLITAGPDLGSYYHEKFLRGKEFLAKYIPCISVGKRSGTRKGKLPDLNSWSFLPQSDRTSNTSSTALLASKKSFENEVEEDKKLPANPPTTRQASRQQQQQQQILQLPLQIQQQLQQQQQQQHRASSLLSSVPSFVLSNLQQNEAFHMPGDLLLSQEVSSGQEPPRQHYRQQPQPSQLLFSSSTNLPPQQPPSTELVASQELVFVLQHLEQRGGEESQVLLLLRLLQQVEEEAQRARREQHQQVSQNLTRVLEGLQRGQRIQDNPQRILDLLRQRNDGELPYIL